jgi:hypothetical protein
MNRRLPVVLSRTAGFGLLALFALAGGVATARAAGAAVPDSNTAKVTGPANAAQGRERDLGGGLVYFRMHHLPADLPPRENGRVPPCVVDLRYVRTDSAGAAAFGFWIGFRASLRTPVFVLANRETDGALLASARAHATSGGVLLVGIPGDNFQPDIAVTATDVVEKQAYDAFDHGATIASLLTDYPGKVRYDERSLGKERAVEPAATEPAADAAPAAAPVTQVDPVLQRAVHLHRALVAMKKL